jgi:hypothetical protein
MRIKCIACDVLARPVYLAAAYSPHTVDVILQRFGLHITPNQLRDVLQEQIYSADEAGLYDVVVLAYGLCGKATHGLRAGSIPLVIPRAHDCITLFLGGRARYEREFSECPGTYWYVQDFIARGDSEDIPLSIGAYTTADTDTLYAAYVEKYGEDNAAYLMEVMQAWQAHYDRAAFIDLGLGDGEDAIKRAHDDAQHRGWRFERIAGDVVLVRRLLVGDWDSDFLILQPGQMVEMSADEEIIGAG